MLNMEFLEITPAVWNVNIQYYRLQYYIYIYSHRCKLDCTMTLLSYSCVSAATVRFCGGFSFFLVAFTKSWNHICRHFTWHKKTDVGRVILSAWRQQSGFCKIHSSQEYWRLKERSNQNYISSLWLMVLFIHLDCEIVCRVWPPPNIIEPDCIQFVPRTAK